MSAGERLGYEMLAGPLALIYAVFAVIFAVMGVVYVTYTPPGPVQLVVGVLSAVDAVLLILAAAWARRQHPVGEIRRSLLVVVLICGSTSPLVVLLTGRPEFLISSVLGLLCLATFVPDRLLLQVVGAGYLGVSTAAGAANSFADPWVVCLAQLAAGCAAALLVQTGRRQALTVLAAATGALQRQAVTDELTGLDNRRGLFERAEELAEEATTRGVGVSVLFVDVDGLKTVNDSQGHTAGDELIRAAAGVLAYCSKDTDALARIGGDEFVLLLAHDDVAGTVARIERQLAEVNGAHRALRVLGRPTAVTSRGPQALSLSVGTSLWHPPQTGLSEVLDRADKAMYEHKRSRRSPAVPHLTL